MSARGLNCTKRFTWELSVHDVYKERLTWVLCEYNMCEERLTLDLNDHDINRDLHGS